MSRPSKREIVRRSRLQPRTRRGAKKVSLAAASSRPKPKRVKALPVADKATRQMLEEAGPVVTLWRRRRDRGELDEKMPSRARTRSSLLKLRRSG